MCLAACHWASVSSVVFGATIQDAKACGFRELLIPAEQMARLGGSAIQVRGGLLRDEAMELFRLWTVTVKSPPS